MWSSVISAPTLESDFFVSFVDGGFFLCFFGLLLGMVDSYTGDTKRYSATFAQPCGCECSLILELVPTVSCWFPMWIVDS